MKRLTAAEVAEQLYVEQATVCRWAAAGTLRGFKVGRRWLFDQPDVDAFATRKPSRPEAPTRRRRRRAA